MRTVEDVLESKARPFNFIEPDALVFDALQLMNSVNLSYLVVMHGTTFYGIFSERDYSRNVILKGLHSNSTTVKDVMSVALPQVGLHETVEHCMNLLNTHKTRYLIVMHEGQFRGVVTINDVLREAIANKEMVFDDAALQQATESQDKIY